MTRVWHILCVCGFDEDILTLKLARREGQKHLGHDADGKVYIDEIDTDPGPFDDYLTGKSVVLSSKA